MRCAPELAHEHVQDARVYANRRDLLSTAKRNAICAEIGVQTGRWSAYLFQATDPRALHLIDIDLSQLQSDEPDVGKALASEKVQLHEGDSVEVISGFPESHFDWVYIDADHSLEGVRRDVEALMPRVKADGVWYFNDYVKYSPLEGYEYGVMEAVNEMCIDRGFRISALALQGLGYFDVALTRS